MNPEEEESALYAERVVTAVMLSEVIKMLRERDGELNKLKSRDTDGGRLLTIEEDIGTLRILRDNATGALESITKVLRPKGVKLN
jgi:hypothetical protein